MMPLSNVSAPRFGLLLKGYNATAVAAQLEDAGQVEGVSQSKDPETGDVYLHQSEGKSDFFLSAFEETPPIPGNLYAVNTMEDDAAGRNDVNRLKKAEDTWRNRRGPRGHHAEPLQTLYAEALETDGLLGFINRFKLGVTPLNSSQWPFSFGVSGHLNGKAFGWPSN